MSDVTLYPTRGQFAQVNGKNEYIIYVPRADKYTYGTVKIGEGLNVVDGVISVDAENAATIKTIAKNGTDLVPDKNKRVNIEITKADVGLNNVDNTADLDKPISTATQAAIDKLSHDLMDDVMTVQESLDDYKLVVDNKFAEQKSDIDGGLLVINNTISQNKTQTDSAIERIEEVLKGKEQAVAFTNYQAVVNAFNMAATNKYNVGQSIYVQSVNVPDLWVYSIENTHIDFAYIGDEDVIETLETTGTIQFGYYKLAMMETKTTSVANAATLDTAQTFTAKKTFELGGSYVVIDKDFATMQNKKSGGNRINSVYVSNGKTQVGSMDTDGTLFRGIEHTADTSTTNVTGTLQYNGVEVLNKNSLTDSDSIVVGTQDNKIKFELDSELTSRIQKALVTPMTRPTATELVAIDDGNSQTMVEIGDGLSLENGVLKATGGGSSAEGIAVLHENFTTIEGFYNRLVELYDADKECVVSITPTQNITATSAHAMQITSTTHVPSQLPSATVLYAGREYKFKMTEKQTNKIVLMSCDEYLGATMAVTKSFINIENKGVYTATSDYFQLQRLFAQITSDSNLLNLQPSVYYYEVESSEAIVQILNTEV